VGGVRCALRQFEMTTGATIISTTSRSISWGKELIARAHVAPFSTYSAAPSIIA